MERNLCLPLKSMMVKQIVKLPFGNRSRKGVAAVEMAIVAPTILLIAFGVQEVTAAIHLQQTLTICAYEAARVALQPDTTEANVKATCDKILLARRVVNASVKVTPSDYQNKDYGTEITVTVSADLEGNSLGPLLVLSNRSVVGEVTVMKEHGT
ncbi:TadE-like protein [Rosistilla oblonga]|nr:TadE-like protein [Rosistilla oblonga]